MILSPAPHCFAARGYRDEDMPVGASLRELGEGICKERTEVSGEREVPSVFVVEDKALRTPLILGESDHGKHRQRFDLAAVGTWPCLADPFAYALHATSPTRKGTRAFVTHVKPWFSARTRKRHESVTCPCKGARERRGDASSHGSIRPCFSVS